MTEKFANVPTEADTRILSRETIMINGTEALHEKWFWEGIKAESLVFAVSDLGQISDHALLSLARASGLIASDSEPTIKRDSSGFHFVNFNFQS